MSDLKRLLVIGGLLSLLAHWVALDLWCAAHRGGMLPERPLLAARLVMLEKAEKASPKSLPPARPVRPAPSTISAPASTSGMAVQDGVRFSPATAPQPETAPGNSGIRPWSEAENQIVYRLALANVASGEWPAMGEGGRIVLGLSVNEHGLVSDVRLVGPSGNAAFNQAALAWLQHAAKLAPVPAGLQGQAFDLELVVERDQGSAE